MFQPDPNYTYFSFSPFQILFSQQYSALCQVLYGWLTDFDENNFTDPILTKF